ncbi:uncharacterized protein L3040_006954 [Drepanopeziza brunnea f. sp. 'multigermtubi']|uniref:Required for respiratory growth protein 9, mitochondrial n=1 Tax=Marssonina brunnea f. sp. multigermtubi (strain MB_m1) TaxID=1072389 RepID=K1W6Y7_MARBU|nr:mitochondrion organization and biogenesis protein [Drepanopeziza brunnea f. sp. 'multigermtubi' MB_m1]EKD12800.1 mitochondrion organization and biogenesis protein [Drepanopeziza brunnea f. sp. 'multigermtubi' MB_m1]KAJ5038083.1 hypothetical protein L3040_006954 [Drepanopeziza brunnea f. sp. 'multigermtubi']
MSCRCTINTLNLFIRNVAHVDLPSIPRRSPRLFQPCATRSLTPRGHFSLSNRAYSSDAAPKVEDSAEAKSIESRDSDAVAEFSLDALDSILAETKLGGHEDGEGPAGEAKKDMHVTHDYETPLKELFKDDSGTLTRKNDTISLTPDQKLEPSRKERWVLGRNGSKVEVRKTKTDNGEFTLHYSARPSKRVTAPTVSYGVKVKEPVFEDRRERWMIEKQAIKEKYPEGYMPMKRLSPDAIAGIRALNAQQPDYYTVQMLSKEFEVTPEAIIRILRTKWRPNPDEETDRQRRWHNRGKAVWQRLADMGAKPPRQWRELGIGNGKPEWLLRRQGKLEKYVPPPLPALVTTARRREQKEQKNMYGDDEETEPSLGDKIL